MTASPFRPTLTIRLKPPLQDYIRYIMNLEECGNGEKFLHASTRSYLGRLIAPFLEYRPDGVNPLLPGSDKSLFTFYLPLDMNDCEVRRNSAWVSEKNQVNIQNIVDSHFRFHFRVFADDKVRYLRQEHTAKGSIKKVILQFCADMNITYDDITYDMISKAYYRARCKSRKNGTLAGKRMMIGQLFFII